MGATVRKSSISFYSMLSLFYVEAVLHSYERNDSALLNSGYCCKGKTPLVCTRSNLARQFLVVVFVAPARQFLLIWPHIQLALKVYFAKAFSVNPNL